MTSLIKKYHNLLVEYQLCTSNDTDFGIECFTIIARAIMMDIIQERKSYKYVEGLNLSDIQKTMIKYTHFEEIDILLDSFSYVLISIFLFLFEISFIILDI